MAVVNVAAALARILPQLHGSLDVATALTGVYAMRRHDSRGRGGHAQAARVLAEAVAEQLRAETDKGGERVRRCS